MMIRALLSLCLLVCGCGTPRLTGETDGDGSSGPGDSSEASSESESGDPMPLCPDQPGSCPDPECATNTYCGGPLSGYDADGCPRPRCGADSECPTGRTCVRLGDYGSCQPSSWGCSYERGACGCGGTGDCSPDVSICVPDDEAPDPNDAIPTPEAFQARCAAAETQQACEDVEAVHDTWNDNTMWCTWRTWVPVALAANDACEHGEPFTECGMSSASEVGCGEDFQGCMPGGEALVRTNADGQTEVSKDSACASWNEPRCWIANGEVMGGPAACACLCEGFPV